MKKFILLYTVALTGLIFLAHAASDEDQVTVFSLLEEAEPGDEVDLSVRVKNNGVDDLGPGCEVWFKVEGPDMEKWAGFEDCEGHSGGSTKKYEISWTVPLGARGGRYVYWGRVYEHAGGEYTALSDWSGANYFRVVRDTANVLSLGEIDDGMPGDEATLSAKVVNTGEYELGPGCEVWFRVEGPSYSKWVGFADCDDVDVDDTERYRLDWTIPADALEGKYYCRARVYERAGGEYIAVSNWSLAEYFMVYRNSARVRNVGRLGDLRAGEDVTLSARIINTGDYELGPGCEVWFKVEGPSYSKWVGFGDCDGLDEDESREYDVDWRVPLDARAGDYAYWGRVYEHVGEEYIEISEWSDPESFEVLKDSAQIIGVGSVDETVAGETLTLSAEVKNTGGDEFGGGCEIWFKVTGPSYSKWVGPANCVNQQRNSIKNYFLSWEVPSAAHTGTYRYSARVYEHVNGNYNSVSAWSSSESFSVVRPTG